MNLYWRCKGLKYVIKFISMYGRFEQCSKRRKWEIILEIKSFEKIVPIRKLFLIVLIYTSLLTTNVWFKFNICLNLSASKYFVTKHFRFCITIGSNIMCLYWKYCMILEHCNFFLHLFNRCNQFYYWIKTLKDLKYLEKKCVKWHLRIH